METINKTNAKLDMSNYASGSYLLKILNTNGIIVKNFIKMTNGWQCNYFYFSTNDKHMAVN